MPKLISYYLKIYVLFVRHTVKDCRAEATIVEPTQTLAQVILASWRHGTVGQDLLLLQGEVTSTGINDRGINYTY